MALKKNVPAAAGATEEKLSPAKKAAATKAAKAAKEAPAKAEAPAKKTTAKKAAPAPAPETAEATEVEKTTVGKKQIAEGIRAYVTAKGMGLPQKLAELAVEGFEFAVSQSLKGGRDVRLSLGKFTAQNVEARVGRNPSTGEEIQVPAHVAPKFKPSGNFKRMLNGEEPEAEAEAQG